MTIQDFQKMIEATYSMMMSRSAEFSALDAALGDGDHGEAMETAWRVIAAAGNQGGDFKSLLGNMGFEVMMQTSGSTSTLLGGFLLGMSDNAPVATEINASELRAMLRGGLDGVRKNTKAQIGDKTMMDALIPAVEAMEASNSDSCREILQVGAAAAEAGVASTVAMRAAFGRARNLGDKTIGHPDAGATSWAAMIRIWATTI